MRSIGVRDGRRVGRVEAGLTVEERRTRIVEHLHHVESASIDSLAALFAVSRMTIHRDLDRLEEQRVVRKLRGSATLSSSTVFEADLSYRTRLATREKALIAGRVAERVERGMALLVDDSSTAMQVLPLVVERGPLTIITNSLRVQADYARREGITLLALGGSYDRICDAFFGFLAEQSVARLRVDLALLSAAAVRGPRAYFHNPDVARLKLACLSVADRSVLMLDHSKFERSALHLFTHLGAFDEVVSTALGDPGIADALRNEQVRLTLVAGGGAGREETRARGQRETFAGDRHGVSQEDHQRT